MKASELRLGNLVLCNTSIGFVNTIVSVCNLSSDEIVCSYKPTKQFIFCKDALFEPIPLTEGWLLDFGFDKINEYCFGNDKLIIESLMVNKHSCRYRINPNESVRIVELHYVHQLQNLYFALTGKELK